MEVEFLTLYHLNSLTPFSSPAHSPPCWRRSGDRIRQTAEGIGAGRFDPMPDERGHCRFCDYKPLCPSFARLFPKIKERRSRCRASGG